MIGVYSTVKELRDELISVGINTVTFGQISEPDLDKKSLYPLAHITPIGMTLGEQAAVVRYTVVVLDILDVTNENESIVEDELGNVSNMEDILHQLAVKVNIGFQRLKARNDVYYIEDATIELDPILMDYSNRLAGYSFTLNYLVPNGDESSC